MCRTYRWMWLLCWMIPRELCWLDHTSINTAELDLLWVLCRLLCLFWWLLIIVLLAVIIGTAHIMRRAESVTRYSVCPSICLSHHGPTAAISLLQVCCCGPSQQEILIDCPNMEQGNAGSAMLSAYVGSWTQTCSLPVMCTVCVFLCMFVPGTGCNAAYVEKVDNVDKWTGPKDGSPVVRIAFYIMYFLTICSRLTLYNI